MVELVVVDVDGGWRGNGLKPGCPVLVHPGVVRDVATIGDVAAAAAAAAADAQQAARR